MSERSITLNYTLTSKQLVHGALLSRRFLPWYLRHAIGLGWLTIALFTMLRIVTADFGGLPNQPSIEAYPSGWFEVGMETILSDPHILQYCMAWLVVTILYELIVPLKIKILCSKSPSLLANRIWLIDENGLAVEVENAKSQLQWSFVKRWIEDEQCFLLSHSLQHSYMFPKSAFQSTSDQEQFKHWLMTKVWPEAGH